VRAGSSVPLGPVQQYATEKPNAPCEIRVYPGANARFVIYEDDSETYNYEKGQRATVELLWNDTAKTLTIGPRSASFPGMMPTRTMNVVLARRGQNQGIRESDSGVKFITYTGKKLVVKF
jgi:alpha-D-xyloside xylohydrolase